MNIDFLNFFSNFDFLNLLGLLTVFSGLTLLLNYFFTRNKKVAEPAQPVARTFSAKVIECCEAFFPVFIVVLLIRALIAQPFKVPTGSLEPTVLAGDFIFVTQFDYGLHMPLWNNLIIPTGTPKTGQIALFQWPVNQGVTFVKRVIGVPGDHISYINKQLFINGQPIPLHFIKQITAIDDSGVDRTVKEYEETIHGIKHLIWQYPDVPAQNFKNLIVPTGKYFMMGDNRDNSNDSRFWGFVPEANFIGRARIIWFSSDPHVSWQHITKRIRWQRIGNRL